jgi:hypothetical protein
MVDHRMVVMAVAPPASQHRPLSDLVPLSPWNHWLLRGNDTVAPSLMLQHPLHPGRARAIKMRPHTPWACFLRPPPSDVTSAMEPGSYRGVKEGGRYGWGETCLF